MKLLDRLFRRRVSSRADLEAALETFQPREESLGVAAIAVRLAERHPVRYGEWTGVTVVMLLNRRGISPVQIRQGEDEVLGYLRMAVVYALGEGER
ncbi:hypothetical protein GCM10009658_64270 [Planotetraspora silvatica]